MGLQIHYLYSLTPRQFYNHAKGYANKHEAQQSFLMLQVRRMAYFSILPHLKNSQATETSLYAMPWEVKTPEQVQEEETERLQKLQSGMSVWDKIDAAKAAGRLQGTIVN